MQVIHTAIRVPDLETERQFFEAHIGLNNTRSWEDGDIVNYCVGTDSGGEIQLIFDPNEPVQVSRDCLDHIAIFVDEFDTIISSIEDHPACSIVEGPIIAESDGVEVAFVSSPSGFVIELISDI